MSYREIIHDLESHYMGLSDTIDRLDKDEEDRTEIIARLTQEMFDVMEAIKALRKANWRL